MIFKKLFLLIGFFITLHAQPTFEITTKTGTYIDFKAQQAPKTWVGLYKKGTSNDWENVLAWGWVKNSKIRISKISHFAEGDYQARLFFNNSYISEASIDFHVGQNPGNQEQHLIDTKSYPSQATFRIPIKRNIWIIKNDWVGVFKKGLPHTRENLEAWSYVKKDDRYLKMIAIDSKGLSVGLYDIVYFTADTYQEVGPTATLTVKISISHGEFRGIYEGKDVLSISHYNLFKTDNDWVAIFKKNAEPIRKNILHWAYVRNGEVIKENKYRTVIYFPTFPKYNNTSDYKIVLFENDTYNLMAISILNLYDD